MKVFNDLFPQITSLENLFSAWEEFRSDKQKKSDVQNFELNVEQHIFKLHRELTNKKYRHGPCASFYIHDPKTRHIHKATVRDRVLHRAMFRTLNPIFEPTFIANSFACRVGKGVHKGVLALNQMIRKESANYTKSCFALKCDIKKFFETIDHGILLNILRKRVKDDNAMWLLKEVVESFISRYSTLFDRKGLPIGNLTSQLFANVYLNELDQFTKHDLKIKHYVRYTDDFVIMSGSKSYLENLIPPIGTFLDERLALALHPNKVSVRKSHWGIDFLGYVSLPHHRTLRTKTKQRIFRKLKGRVKEYRDGTIDTQTLEQSLQSYLGVLSHANTHKLTEDLKNQFWFWLNE